MRQLSLKPSICQQLDGFPLISNVLPIRLAHGENIVSITLVTALTGETKDFIQQIMSILRWLVPRPQVLDSWPDLPRCQNHTRRTDKFLT